MTLADIVLTDVDYVVSDLHLNHANIVDYCRDERFDTTQAGLDDMNWTLLANWNRQVDADETVVFVGDFAWFMHESAAQRKVDNLWDTLAGEKVFVRGDHDHVIPSSADRVVHAAEIRHGDHAFFVSHFPGDTPSSLPGGGMPDAFAERLPSNVAERWDGWRIHGHHHNNWPDHYPLANPERRTINCSVELTGYRPLSMARVEEIVERNAWRASL